MARSFSLGAYFVRGSLSIIVLLAGFSLCAAEAVPPGLGDLPEIVAEVNGHPITRIELVRELVGSTGPDAVERLVRRILVEQAAKAANVAVTAEEIEQQYVLDTRDLMNEMIRMPWDKKYKEFPMAEIIRARFRMSVEEYKNMVIRQRLLIRRCIAQEMLPTEAELREYFNGANQLFQQPVRYHASHILISPLDPRDMFKGLRFRKPLAQMQAIEQERQKRINLYRDKGITFDDAPPIDQLGPEWERAFRGAEKVKKDIIGGVITWEQAVRQYSQDPLDQPKYNRQTRKQEPSEREQMNVPPGNVGWFHSEGPLVRSFYEGARTLKPGEIGGPVRTEYGWHLIKMIEIDNPPRVIFEQSIDRVRNDFIETAVAMRSRSWLDALVRKANITISRVQLWPPAEAEAATIGVQTAPPSAGADGDPVICNVSGVDVRRSDVWRELVRYEGDEALNRLVNREVVLTLLKNMGMDRLNWESADPQRRNPQPPAAQPINVSVEAIDLELNDDRLRKDRDAPDGTFKQYIFDRYGQSVEEYKRALEAGIVLREAVRRKLKIDDATLQVEFALARDIYAEPPRYDISHILIVPTGGMEKADPNSLLQASIIADEIRKSCVAEPSRFGELAREHSMDNATKNSGGRLGELYPDARSAGIPDFKTIFDELKRGNYERNQITPVMKLSRGYHIFHIDGVHAGRQAEFEEVKPRLERDYIAERAKMYTDIWLDALKSQAKVKRYIFKQGDANEEALPPDNFPLPK